MSAQAWNKQSSDSGRAIRMETPIIVSKRLFMVCLPSPLALAHHAKAYENPLVGIIRPKLGLGASGEVLYVNYVPGPDVHCFNGPTVKPVKQSVRAYGIYLVAYGHNAEAPFFEHQALF